RARPAPTRRTRTARATLPGRVRTADRGRPARRRRAAAGPRPAEDHGRNRTMLRKLRDAISPTRGRRLARAFSRLGWAGFWLQAVFGSITVAGMVYSFAFSRPASETRSGLAFVEYLVIVNLVLLLFTTLWSYRYTRLARRIADPKRRPPESS